MHNWYVKSVKIVQNFETFNKIFTALHLVNFDHCLFTTVKVGYFPYTMDKMITNRVRKAPYM